MFLKISVILLFFSFSEQNNEDSTNTIISELPLHQKIEYLNKLCWNLRSNDPEKAIKYGFMAVELIEKANEPGLLSQTYNFIGVAYRNIGNYSNALTYYSRALANAISFSDSLQIAYSNNNLGGIYRLQGNNAIAIEHMLRALSIFEEKNYNEGIGFCAINIGVLYLNEGNYPKALKYLNLSLKVREEEKDNEGLIHTVKHIARTYFRMAEYDSSLICYKRVMDLAEERSDLKGIAAVYEGYCEINLKLGQYELALANIEKAIKINDQIDYIVGKTKNLFLKALIYAKMNRLVLGETFITQANNNILEMNIEVEKMEGLKYQSLFYETLGKYEIALDLYKRYSNKRDSIFSAESSEDLYVQMTEHQLQKIQDDLKRDLEIRNQQIKYLSIIVILVLVLIFVVFWRNITLKKLSSKLQDANVTKDKFFRILAHDLKNPISASMGYLQLLKDENNSFNEEERSEIIGQAHSSLTKNIVLLENLLEWAKIQNKSTDFNPQNTDLRVLLNDTIENLLPLAKSKNITINADLEISCSCYCDVNMIKTVVRNLITNSIKFTQNNGSIDVSCKRDIKFLSISVKDRGIGIPMNEQAKIFELSSKFSNRGTNNELGSGLGLILCKEYIELNRGKISFESEEGKGSSFTFTIPTEKFAS